MKNYITCKDDKTSYHKTDTCEVSLLYAHRRYVVFRGFSDRLNWYKLLDSACINMACNQCEPTCAYSGELSWQNLYLWIIINKTTKFKEKRNKRHTYHTHNKGKAFHVYDKCEYEAVSCLTGWMFYHSSYSNREDYHCGELCGVLDSTVFWSCKNKNIYTYGFLHLM